MLTGEMLGLPFVPAYLNPQSHGNAILRGVNYASGAGGILDVSGKNYVCPTHLLFLFLAHLRVLI